MIFHRWRPIEPPGKEIEQYDFSEIDSLQRQWLNVKRDKEAANPNAYQPFLERLERRWAIETGIIEGIYDISRGVTQTLVENGLAADLIEAGSTNRDPQELIKVLRDHQNAAEFVTESIRRQTPFSKHYIRELHQILTRNQPTYTAVDQFGTVFETTLDRGGFKVLPNNPTRRDGAVHEYCPPVQVDSELDNLVYFYEESGKARDDFHPLLVGAWLHHAFTQIHPFQDGNGRVARAILTWHLVKEGYWPIVVSRDDREHYITCLEQADAGNLTPFVEFLVQQEKQTILQALSEPESAPALQAFDQVLDHLVQGIHRKQCAQEEQLRAVNHVAEYLQSAVRYYLADRHEQISRRLGEAGMVIQPSISAGGPYDGREHWYGREVNTTAQNAGHWASSNEARYFAALLLRGSADNPANARLPVLRFVVSLHHVGKELSGVMAATAFARIERPQGTADDDEVGAKSGELHFHDCTVSPFTFTNDESDDAIRPRFTRWVEEHLTIALTKWGEYLT